MLNFSYEERVTVMVVVNGENKNIDGMTVAQYLEHEGLASDRIAVMLGDDIVPKSSYKTTVLADGDTLEVVGFVGGG